MSQTTSILLVTLAIQSSSGLASNVHQIAFDAFPSSEDVASQLGDPAYQELLEACEVDDLADYAEDLEASDDRSLLFECRLGDKLVGTISVEAKELIQASTTSVD